MEMSDDVARVVTALSDATRRAMLLRLASGPATAGQLGIPFAISQPATSRHLRVLREAGLVRVTSTGRNWWYELAGSPLLELRGWLDDLVERWAGAPTLELSRSPILEST